ncbi:MAG: YicC family protein [Pseudomonas sp. PGPPP3]|nr:MAG: YicC family protein [Pseudomonas sp. PGPPP3]
MVHSMTAFARTERAGTHGTLSWELRSVNHRYLEPQLRLPEAFRDLEGSVRDALRQGLSRGKVESAPPYPLVAVAWPGVLVADGTDPQAQNAEAMQLFNQALDELKNGRGREGAELAKLLNERLDAMTAEVATLRELVPQMLATQRQKILDRFTEMKAELDPQRLEQELVLLAQKSDVAEELDRLSTHVSEVHRVLKAGGAAGRRLDFLMQELNREANTLGSKAFDPRSTQAAVSLKVLIEQMREQVQNIE